MPIERRDPNSKAKLFIPTVEERTLIGKHRVLDSKIKEVDEMRAELDQLIKSLKKDK